MTDADQPQYDRPPHPTAAVIDGLLVVTVPPGCDPDEARRATEIPGD